MGSEVGQSGSPVAEYTGIADASVFHLLRQQIEEEPYRFHFFQAVRLLQRMDPERKPVGYFVPPSGEVVRFTSRPSLAFPASEIHDLERDEHGQARMNIEFMGLCCSLSVLPNVYTEHMLERINRKDKPDHAMEEFFNIFNHRMISMFYRGWEKYRYYVAYERSGEDKLSALLFDLLGLGTEGMRERSGVPDRFLLSYVAHLAPQVRSSMSLEQLLEEYFEVPVQISQFIGSWSTLPPAHRTCLDEQGRDSGVLGRGTIVGDEVWDQHGRIRVTIGPMRLARYLEFLPGKGAHRDLVAWLRFFSNGSYESEVRLILAREEVPHCTLGSDQENGPKLGLLSWLRTRPIERDPGDAMYLVE
jgi:type VI secretion system protein ImpH